MRTEILASQILQEKNSLGIRDEDNPNVDQLIVKPNLYAYVNKNQVDDVRKNGLFSPMKQLERFPNADEEIKSMYGGIINHNELKDTIPLFIVRVPYPKQEEERANRFFSGKTPIKVSLGRLGNAKKDIFLFLVNNLLNPKKVFKFPVDKVSDLIKKEDEWFNLFQKSKDQYYRDVPHAAIKSIDGNIPAFACKILGEDD